MCYGRGVHSYHRDRRRDYLQCATCQLVFVPPQQRPDLAAERREYDLHRNDVDNPGYRRFLSRLYEPLVAMLPPDSVGLEFGCGPGPALAHMLEDCGHRVQLYDPYYFPDSRWRDQSFDFITATEVVEHLHEPGRELDALWSRLKAGGVLGIMTKLVRDPEAFAGWHYKNDPTHVCFFSRSTWQWWAHRKKATLNFHGADVMLLQR